MTKTELIEKVVEKTGLTKKDAGKVVEAVFESMKDALAAGDKIQLIGFGNFEVKLRQGRKGKNPRTGEEIDIPARKIPVFKPGKGLKDVVDK